MEFIVLGDGLVLIQYLEFSLLERQDIVAPKRAMSAYMLFGQAIRASIVQENPDFLVGQP
jgi:hypothetical protein